MSILNHHKNKSISTMIATSIVLNAILVAHILLVDSLLDIYGLTLVIYVMFLPVPFQLFWKLHHQFTIEGHINASNSYIDLTVKAVLIDFVIIGVMFFVDNFIDYGGLFKTLVYILFTAVGGLLIYSSSTYIGYIILIVFRKYSEGKNKHA